MKVQAKILLLLLVTGTLFAAGLFALRLVEQRLFRAIAERRVLERDQQFDRFMAERGDQLKVLVEDSALWDDLVQALAKRDTEWASEHIDYQSLATYEVNAVWIYRPEGEVFYSINNRYSSDLSQLPLTSEQLRQIFAKESICHFFIEVPQGWMEVRGATIHQSVDHFRQTPPRGYYLAGHIWIDENIRRMSLFTGYSVRIGPADAAVPAIPDEGGEETGLIRFVRTMPGWDGKPAAQIQVENDSPLIRELNSANRRQFLYLLIGAAVFFLVLAYSLLHWIRRPLHIISDNLRAENQEGLAILKSRPDEFGELARLILQSRETEQALQQAEENLRHAQKLEAVGRLAGGIAHDFNNLLTAIIGFSDLLLHRLTGQPEAHSQVQIISQAGRQAASLTRQLLAFSRKQLLEPRVLDLNELVAEGRNLLQRVIGEHIAIELLPEASDARVRADPGQIEQVVLNLGVNARDAMLSGGKLKIRTENVTIEEEQKLERNLDLAPGRFVVLEVCDSGEGMDADTLDRIFEPFFTTKGPGRGTGLGLATVYGIVKQSNGGITVHSEPGKGSRFRVYLPLTDAPVEPEREPVTPGEARQSETILVCEDEEVVRELVAAVLERAGYTLLMAEKPSVAKELAAAHGGPIDLLVTDVVMPEMHGPELVKHLTKMQPGLPVLYISGYSENDISDQGVVHTDLPLLHKPFTQADLLRRVREVLDARLKPA